MGNTSLSLTGIAHGVAKKSAHDRAASRFFLGKKAGSAFYNVFPPAVHESTIWTILIVLGSRPDRRRDGLHDLQRPGPEVPRLSPAIDWKCCSTRWSGS